MRKEELQELINELQDTCDSLSSRENNINNLIRLTSCMGKMKSYPQYSTVADEMLDLIGDYDEDDPYSLELIIANTELLISVLSEVLEEDSILDLLKMGYKGVKDTIYANISDEVKDAYKETATQFKDACKVKVDQAKDVRRNAEKIIKSKLRNWLLSDDDE